jgi:hypothetical protein
MKLLLVQTYPGANETVKRHYPYFVAGGFGQVVGVTTEGGGCYWPTLDTVEVGRNQYFGAPGLSERLIRTLEAGLKLGADELAVIEYDVLFFRPLPALPGDGIAMVVTGGSSPGYKSKSFFHCPWYMNAATAERVIEVGNQLIEAEEHEQGWPDRFMGLIVDRSGIPVFGNLFSRYTRNTISEPSALDEAKEAIARGAHAVHGIKTEAQLNHILGR